MPEIGGVVRKQNDQRVESTRRRYLTATGTTLGVAALASGSAAAGGKDEKDDDKDDDSEEIDDVDELPIVIDESGNFVLDDDLNVEEDETGVIIEASNVSLDGDGNTISGDGSGTGIDIDAGSDVSVENLELENLEGGIEVEDTRRTRISDITVIDSLPGVQIDGDISQSSVVRNSTFENSDIQVVTPSQVSIIRNTIVGAPGSGIFVESVSGVTNVIENAVSDSEGAGVLFNGASGLVILNEFSNNGGPGVVFQDRGSNNAFLNEITDNDGSGVEIDDSSNNTITDNRITDNGGAGVDILGGSNNTITDNNLGNNDDGPCNLGERATENEFDDNDPECDEG